MGSRGPSKLIACASSLDELPPSAATRETTSCVARPPPVGCRDDLSAEIAASPQSRKIGLRQAYCRPTQTKCRLPE
jgi:hypothetical protein